MTPEPAAFPPPDPTEKLQMEPAPVRLRHPVALFAAAAGLGLVAAIVAGVGAGGLVMAASSSDCSPSDGWCELGAVVIGALVGVVIGAIAYVVAGVTTVVRCRPAGTRAMPVLAHLAFPVALVAFVAAMQVILP